MNDRQPRPTDSTPAAPDELVAARVDRAQTELRHGRAVRLGGIDAPARGAAVEVAADSAADVAADGAAVIVAVIVAVEGLTADRLRWLASLGAPVQLLLTAERAQALVPLAGPRGMATSTVPALLTLPAGATLEAVLDWAAVTPAGSSTAAALLPAAAADLVRWGQVLNVALTLAKRARLTPALLLVQPTAVALPQVEAAQLLSVSCAEVQRMQHHAAFSLRRVSDAQVPIAAHADCTLVLFREDHGAAEHVAIVVGTPDFSQPVPVRLHSSCLTGDLLGSLRCDCGDQLRRAIDRLAETGGVLLYLEQEGRSIGLANKLRAYRLQDDGLDTIDADRSLGFMADERDYRAAVAMLDALGITRIRLLTNNPKKIAALAAGGIEVVERLALHGPVNPHNARYIETKQARAGHFKSK